MPAAVWWMLGGSAVLGSGGYALSESTSAALKLGAVAAIGYILVKKGIV